MRGVLRRIRRRLVGAGPVTPGPHDDSYPAFPREQWHLYDEPAAPTQPGGLPIPNYALRVYVGTGDLAMFLAIGEAWAQLVSRYLPAEPTVLDLGCGSGKIARFLHLNPRLRYVGVDLFLPHIQWSRRAFAAAGDRFRFEHFDGYSNQYNPTGRMAAADYVLPVGDASVDMAICSSLFTHLLEPDARHYLAELRRVLRPGGRAMVSLHVDVPAGQVYVGDESRIDVDEAYFLGLAEAAGLTRLERVGVIYGQVLYALTPRPD
jgi:SAM-dependent methyltransferase